MDRPCPIEGESKRPSGELKRMGLRLMANFWDRCNASLRKAMVDRIAKNWRRRQLWRWKSAGKQGRRHSYDCEEALRKEELLSS